MFMLSSLFLVLVSFPVAIKLKDNVLELCIGCRLGKSHHFPFDNNDKHCSSPLDLIYFDLGDLPHFYQNQDTITLFFLLMTTPDLVGFILQIKISCFHCYPKIC